MYIRILLFYNLLLLLFWYFDTFYILSDCQRYVRLAKKSKEGETAVYWRFFTVSTPLIFYMGKKELKKKKNSFAHPHGFIISSYFSFFMNWCGKIFSFVLKDRRQFLVEKALKRTADSIFCILSPPPPHFLPHYKAFLSHLSTSPPSHIFSVWAYNYTLQSMHYLHFIYTHFLF